MVARQLLDRCVLPWLVWFLLPRAALGVTAEEVVRRWYSGRKQWMNCAGSPNRPAGAAIDNCWLRLVSVSMTAAQSFILRLR